MLTNARYIIIFVLSVFMNIHTIPTAQARDNEFGAPFWNQTASALKDRSQDQQPEDALLATDMDAIAKSLQNIQPAAGDEKTDAGQADANAKNTQKTEKSAPTAP